MENQKPRNPLNANPRTTVIFSDLYPNSKGKIIRQNSKTKMIECWFKDIGFVTVHFTDLIAFKDDGSNESVKGDESEKVHGTGAAGNRLANWLKAKARRDQQTVVASGERALWAEPMRAPAKASSKLARKIIESGKSDSEQNYLLRMALTKDKGVSDKKGTKRRVSASDVQARHIEFDEQ